MRFQVPQNLDVPDTIFFNLTFKQFLFLGGGIGSFVGLLLFTNLIIAIVVGGPIFGLGLAFAFFKKDHLSFPDLLNVMLKYFVSKKIYTWQKDSTKQTAHVSKASEEIKDVIKTPSNVGEKIKEKNAQLGFQETYIEDDEEVNI